MSFVRFVPQFLSALPERAGRAPPTGRTIFLGPLMIAIIFAATLVWAPQAREIYLDVVVGGGDLRRGLLGLLCVQWLAIALYAWNATLVGRRIDEIYAETPSLSADRWLKSVRDRKALIAAMLPPLALVLGLVRAIPDVRQAAVWIGESDPELVTRLADVPQRMWLAALVALVAGCATMLLLVALRRTRHMVSIDRLSLVAATLIYVLPFCKTDTIVDVARWIGPLASFALLGVAVVPTIQYLVVGIVRVLFATFVSAVQGLTRRLGPWPLVGVLAIAMGAWLWELHVANSGSAGVDPVVRTVALNEAGSRTIENEFEDWLVAREIVRGLKPKSKFPIFVIAAQGGGIYAASSTMSLLAGLQDRCSRFARHVFAISAVSGGAIGAAAFQRFAANGGGRGGVSDCSHSSQPPGLGPLSERATRIATDDHLSALIVSTPVDWVSKLPLVLAKVLEWPLWHLDLLDHGGLGASFLSWLGESAMHARVDALAASFKASFKASDPAAKSVNAGTGLDVRHDKYWTPALQSPSLLLNATSAETGQRVAFAPYSLIGVGDGTLHAFGDLDRMLHVLGPSRNDLDKLELIDAAVTSARFPGILPAWSLHHAGRTGVPQVARRLNFVDGGYLDPSGATTAVDVVERLQKFTLDQKYSDAVEVHVVLLTDNDSVHDIATAHGSNLLDVAAPLQALLNARSQLSGAAVLRARNELEVKNIRVLRIELDHRMFSLPLGWQLSRISHDIITTMLGDGSSCRILIVEADVNDTEVRALRSGRFEQLVNRNNCAQRRILDLLQ